MKTFKYRLYPTDNIKVLTSKIKISGTCYNHVLSIYKTYIKLFKKLPKSNLVKSHLVKQKKIIGYGYLSFIDAQSLQSIVEKIDTSYKTYFSNKKAGINFFQPSFRKTEYYTSFVLKQHNWYYKPGQDIFYLYGLPFKFYKSREILGNIKIVIVKKEKNNICICVVTDYVEEIQANSVVNNTVGLTLVNDDFIYLSNGTVINFPDEYIYHSKKLKRMYSRLSKKVENSNNFYNYKMQIDKQNTKLHNVLTSFFNKVAKDVTINYDVIWVKDVVSPKRKNKYRKNVIRLSLIALSRAIETEANKRARQVVYKTKKGGMTPFRLGCVKPGRDARQRVATANVTQESHI